MDTPSYLVKRWKQPSRQHNGVPFVTPDKKGCDLGVRGTVYRRLFDRPLTRELPWVLPESRLRAVTAGDDRAAPRGAEG